MRILSNISPVIRILLWVMFALSIVILVFSTLIACGVQLPVEISPAQAVPSLFASSLVAVVSLLFATVHYYVGEQYLRLNLAFFDILGGRIRLENILNIVMMEGKMYISYIWQGQDPVIAQIAISPKHYEKMKKALMEKNPSIVFYDKDRDADIQNEGSDQ